MMEDYVTFKCGELSSYCFKRFQDMKEKSKFCDITIRYGSHTIAAHRLVLAAAIPYFGDFLGRSEKQEISMELIDPKALESLVEFAYTCQVTITTENARDLFSAACILKIDQVRDSCCEFLAERLTPDNALSTRKLAKSFSCAVLLESVDSFICRNFDKIAETRDFLNSSFTCLKQLIGRNDLQCSEEGNVLDFVMKWVKTSPELRKEYLPLLLREIRMSVLTPEYLTDLVSKEELIRFSVECRDIVDDAKTYHFLPRRRSEISSFVTRPRAVPKKNLPPNDPLTPGIYAVSRSTVLSMQRFDVKTGVWSAQKANSFHSDFHNGVLLAENGNLYYSDRKDLRSYTSENGKWIRNGDVRSSKHNFGAAVLNNKIYLCGGQEGGLASRLVECYDLETDDSKSVQSLSAPRCFPGVVALGQNLYVLGGCCDGVVCNTVEKYYPRIDTWGGETPMLTERCGMGCTTLGGKIYVCGGLRSFGNDGEKDELLASVEVYDIISKKWSWVSSISTPRFACSFVAYYGKLYLIGGYDENDVPMHTTEVYDPATDEWKMGSILGECTGFVQAAAILSVCRSK